MLRIGALLAGLTVLTVSHPALAQTMTATEARSFVVGKLFTFNCFEGTKGAGRIHADGSVAGTIQFRGAGPVRWAQLPASTINVKGESGLRHREGAAVPALLQSAEDEPQELPRLGLGSRLRVLRIQPPRSGGNRHRERAGQSAGRAAGFAAALAALHALDQRHALRSF